MNITALAQAVIYGDSAYPSGRYTLSHGLEGLVHNGQVRGTLECSNALQDYLQITAAPGDGTATAITALLAQGTDPTPQASKLASTGSLNPADALPTPQAGKQALELLIDLDWELEAMKVTQELRKASTRVGRQTLNVHQQVHAQGLTTQSMKPTPTGHAALLASYAQRITARETPGNQAVAMGLIHTVHGLAPQEAVAVELTSLAVGWASAALRLSQCDHVDAQAMVAAAVPLINELSHDSVRRAHKLVENTAQPGSCPFATLGRSSPGLDLASAQHSIAPARLFMS